MKRTINISLVALVMMGATLCAILLLNQAAGADTRPNIAFVLVDNVGPNGIRTRV